MEKQELYIKAYNFAKEKHSGQTRIGGEPYISHPAAVAEMLYGKGLRGDYIVTALFHDLLEDTDATEEEILAIGGCDVLKAVKLLTKKKGCDMQEYVNGIRSNDIAFNVKCADRLHNLNTAVCADSFFIKQYIEETEKWYLDFSEDIVAATAKLKKVLNRRTTA